MSEQIPQEKDRRSGSGKRETGRASSQPQSVSLPPGLVQRAMAAPHTLTPADVLQLQRTVGNRAVQRLLASQRPYAGAHSTPTPASNPGPSPQIQRQTRPETDRLVRAEPGELPRVQGNDEVIQRWPFDWLGPVNPRLYAPTMLGGYSPTQMREQTNPDPPVVAKDFPYVLKQSIKGAFNVVAKDEDKKNPDDLTRAEYDTVAKLLQQIWAGTTNLVISPQLAGSDVKLLDDQDEKAKARKSELAVETMQDVIRIAQTTTGRDLLRTVAKEAQKVFINPYDLFMTASANPRFKNKVGAQSALVTYTPGVFKTRRAENSQVNMQKQTAAAKHNPWVAPQRTDITLYHELIHAFHIQTNTAKSLTQLVGSEDTKTRPVDPVDAPYDTQEMDKTERRGVSEEEYYTVGLGPYENERFTENRYRRERKAMGEDIHERGYYTNKDERGERAGDFLG